jgi:hypothetical protein
MLCGMNRPLCARCRERVYVGPYDAFVHRGGFSHDVDLLFGVLQKNIDVFMPCATDDAIQQSELTLRMCTLVAGQITLILTSGLSSEGLSQPNIHAY